MWHLSLCRWPGWLGRCPPSKTLVLGLKGWLSLIQVKCIPVAAPLPEPPNSPSCWYFRSVPLHAARFSSVIRRYPNLPRDSPEQAFHIVSSRNKYAKWFLLSSIVFRKRDLNSQLLLPGMHTLIPAGPGRQGLAKNTNRKQTNKKPPIVINPSLEMCNFTAFWRLRQINLKFNFKAILGLIERLKKITVIRLARWLSQERRLLPRWSAWAQSLCPCGGRKERIPGNWSLTSTHV